jgi:hypothetical protein
MATYKLNYYKITSSGKGKIIKFSFNECRHEAKVKSVDIKFTHNKEISVIDNLTLGDLKELRKVVRKRIKELHQRI